MISVKSGPVSEPHHGVELLLQVVVPGLLGRHDAIAEGLLAPPQDLLRNEVEAFEGVPQEELLHSALEQHREKTAVCCSFSPVALQ